MATQATSKRRLTCYENSATFDTGECTLLTKQIASECKSPTLGTGSGSGAPSAGHLGFTCNVPGRETCWTELVSAAGAQALPTDELLHRWRHRLPGRHLSNEGARWLLHEPSGGDSLWYHGRQRVQLDGANERLSRLDPTGAKHGDGLHRHSRDLVYDTDDSVRTKGVSVDLSASKFADAGFIAAAFLRAWQRSPNATDEELVAMAWSDEGERWRILSRTDQV
jgi:hypothetical protein